MSMHRIRSCFEEGGGGESRDSAVAYKWCVMLLARNIAVIPREDRKARVPVGNLPSGNYKLTQYLGKKSPSDSWEAACF